MTLKSTERLLQLLRAYGVSHFKSPEIELRIDAPPSSNSLIAVGSPSLVPQTGTKSPPNAAAAPPVDMEIPHHINEVKKLLKLSDDDLVEALFPEPKPEKAE